MQSFPSRPPVAQAPTALLEHGHLWIEELIAGLPLRFRMDETGLLTFGSDQTVFDRDAIPLNYQHAVRAVREQFDRQRFRTAVATPEAITFFAVTVQHCGIPYDWSTAPALLGIEIWDGIAGNYRGPAAVQQIFTQVGLQPINTIDRERHVRGFDPEQYAMPASAWYDGPVAGIVLRDKTGNRGVLRGGAFPDSTPPEHTLGTISEDIITDQWLTTLVADLQAMDEPLTVTTVTNRGLERLARENWAIGTDQGPPIERLRTRLSEQLARVLE